MEAICSLRSALHCTPLPCYVELRIPLHCTALLCTALHHPALPYPCLALPCCPPLKLISILVFIHFFNFDISLILPYSYHTSALYSILHHSLPFSITPQNCRESTGPISQISHHPEFTSLCVCVTLS